MPGPNTTMLIEGSFEELADELAQYIDNLKNDDSSIQSECAALLQENKKDEVLKKLVMGSQTLNQAPEKGTLELECSSKWGMDANE
jgi:translation initiation factor 3 subunit M